MDEATSIQLAFPSEPHWPDVSDAALVQLVQAHNAEPSCAQSAITELKSRNHPDTQALCLALLSSRTTDKWLRSGALGILLSIDPMHGLDTAMEFIDKCDPELLDEVIGALNYEHQGMLSDGVHRHPIVERVRYRLSQPNGGQAEFGPLFIKNFGV